MQIKADTAEQYMEQLPEDRKVAISKLRKVILANPAEQQLHCRSEHRRICNSAYIALALSKKLYMPTGYQIKDQTSLI